MKFRFPSCTFHSTGFRFRSPSCKKIVWLLDTRYVVSFIRLPAHLTTPCLTGKLMNRKRFNLNLFLRWSHNVNFVWTINYKVSQNWTRLSKWQVLDEFVLHSMSCSCMLKSCQSNLNTLPAPLRLTAWVPEDSSLWDRGRERCATAIRTRGCWLGWFCVGKTFL